MKGAIDISKLHLHWRTSKYKDQTYYSYSLARAYREDGKNRREIVMSLGKLADAQANKWREYLKAIKESNSFLTTLEDLYVTERFAFLDVSVVSAIWDQWELGKVFKDKGRRDLDVATIARILTINRCIDPTSKCQVPDWFNTTSLPWLLDITASSVNASRIFRELTTIEDHREKLCQHLFNLLRERYPQSMKRVFYDLSSASFTGTKCLLMKWGHCKEGYDNHVVLAIVVNSKGLPFYWEVLPGGTADSTTISWLLGRLEKQFKDLDTTVIFDRGMVSDDNLESLETAKIKYISAMDRNQIEGITSIDFNAFTYLDPDKIAQQVNELDGFTKFNDSTYYREVKVIDKRRYVLCFNPQLFKDQDKIRKQAIVNFRAFVESLNKELRDARMNRKQEATYKKFKTQIAKAKLTEFVDVSLTPFELQRKTEKGEHTVQTYQAEVTVDDTKMLAAKKLDGFWLLVTNHSEKEEDQFLLPAPLAIDPYREKTIIESAFRDIKSFIEVAPFFVWTDQHVKAHFTICVLAYLINRTLTMLLHENTGPSSKHIITHEQLYKTLAACQIDHIQVNNVGLSTHKLTQTNQQQLELLDRVRLPQLLSLDIAKKANAV